MDGVEFCFMDLIKGIEENTALNDFRVLWVKNGALKVVSNGVELLYMWDQIKVVKGCTIYMWKKIVVLVHLLTHNQ